MTKAKQIKAEIEKMSNYQLGEFLLLWPDFLKNQGIDSREKIEAWLNAEGNLEKFQECSTNIDGKGVLNQPLYVLRVGSAKSSKEGSYAYRIYPVELTIKAIHIGKEGLDPKHGFYYGPGEVTWLCQSRLPGQMESFSPVGDEILSNMTVAGRQRRGFFDKNRLQEEADILKDLIFQTYKNVERVEIDLLSGFCMHEDLADKIKSAENTNNSINESIQKSHQPKHKENLVL